MRNAAHTFRNVGNAIQIALVNNMPDGAFKESERQFRTLLTAALPECALSFRLFSSPKMHRRSEVGAYVARNYVPLEQLGRYRFDAVVVTGAEPLAANLPDESFWSDLQATFDMVARRGIPAMFSCLAAHAAALHFDGIPRTRLPGKKSGVFPQLAAHSHISRLDIPSGSTVPHSRLNTLDDMAIRKAGYTVVSHVGSELDIFTKKIGGPMLFLQGHPEYDAISLQAEYQRDMALFWQGRRTHVPSIPEGYFDPSTEQRLRELLGRSSELAPVAACHALGEILVLSRPKATWRIGAERLVASWLAEALGSDFMSAQPLPEFA